MKGLVYLVKVDVNNNHNVYYRMTQKNEIFVIEYGRVGATPVVSKRPMTLWDETYNKKISEGYIDRTDMVTVTSTSEKKYREIEDETVNKLVQNLLSYSKHTLETNYEISYKDVSQKMVDNAQDILYDMAQNPTLQYIREQLPKLYVMIPRKMSDVSKSLPTNTKDIPDVLQAEQDLLDVMAAKVAEIQIQNNKNGPNKTILETMGISIEEVVDEKTIASIKKYLSAESSHLFKRAYRVHNKMTDDRFYGCMKKYHYTEKDIHYLYHGSGNDNYWGIITQGQKLNPKKVVISGKMFGMGLYYAFRAKKSINYTSLQGSYYKKGASKTAYLAVYKVLYKNPLDVTVWQSKYTSYTGKEIAPNDALFAHKGVSLLNDELIIYHENQATIHYLIELGV